MPLTRDRTKPAVPSGEIYRFINFTLSNCVNSGIYKRGIKSAFDSSLNQCKLNITFGYLGTSPKALYKICDIVY